MQPLDGPAMLIPIIIGAVVRTCVEGGVQVRRAVPPMAGLEFEQVS